MNHMDDNIGRGRMLPPLPERMRPHNLDGYVGQRHLVGKGCILRNMIENGNLSSFILWGPPGVGKTTLSHIVSSRDSEFDLWYLIRYMQFFSPTYCISSLQEQD